MSDYVKITDYAAKDALLSGNPAKIVAGTEIGADFDAVAVAVATKINTSSIGTTVQAYDATLTSIAALGTAADKIAYTTGVNTWAETAITAAARTVLDDTTVGSMLTTLGAASLAGNIAQAFSSSNFTTAQGIQFPATQNASADANNLDDYEEGTWTPNVTNATVVGTPTYTGTYTKIGRKVTLQFKAESTTSVAFTRNSTSVTGLPFTTSNKGGSGTSINNSIVGETSLVFDSTLYPGTVPAAVSIFTTVTYEV